MPKGIPGSHPICAVEGCERPHLSKGYCSMHYQRLRTRGDVGGASRERNPLPLTCAAEGCDLTACAKGLCKKHYRRWRAHGTTDLVWTHPTGPSRWNWRGGRRQAGGGYWEVYIGPDDPLYAAASGSRRSPGRYMLEHRYVMAQMLGRPLIQTEQVHHINGDRADNRPGNLELWSHSQPCGQRIEDKLAWAREFIALYGDDFVQPRLLE